MKEQLHQKKGSADPDSFTPQESDHFQSFLADAEVLYVVRAGFVAVSYVGAAFVPDVDEAVSATHV